VQLAAAGQRWSADELVAEAEALNESAPDRRNMRPDSGRARGRRGTAVGIIGPRPPEVQDRSSGRFITGAYEKGRGITTIATGECAVNPVGTATVDAAAGRPRRTVRSVRWSIVREMPVEGSAVAPGVGDPDTRALRMLTARLRRAREEPSRDRIAADPVSSASKVCDRLPEGVVRRARPERSLGRRSTPSG